MLHRRDTVADADLTVRLILAKHGLQLTVDDGPNSSAPVMFLVNVTDETGNSRPIADVSLSSTTGVVGLFTTVDGTRSSDADGDLLTFEWSIVLQPAGSQAAFINEFAPQTEITFDTAGLYRIQLVVSDGLLDSFPVRFLIDVATPASQPNLPHEASAAWMLGDVADEEDAEVSALDTFFDELGR